ncbi:hypothetical protein PVOR_02181 [Paenibacillus vortex V453]|jgi:hypothetical protein|uniref:Lipoprotein n=2 Tax=Paenibacillus TaxID=44249 RepID=A0A163IX40_9BACL|nr:MULTISPECIES: hypothetical protein [Paenibacillaceae]RKM07324.1 hypothetical protein D6D84_05295 [Moraxella catarrhalis]ANA80196.1 hypothetical protein A3958_09480 [Paenibacillus glucanolyticus]AVV55736.1 hypothetical protein C7121_06050 [Paenibacillus glucanolyticus]AWP30316.1 hypothetical protein B9D94_28560 [Paenibacillus sp. Cedars]EFU43507.1 hypothetical protein PVOR_02181 [Paenibacillus vortex V453]
MLRKNSLRVAEIICAGTILLIGSGCGASTEPSWKSFDGAANVKSFPVPKEANKTEQTTGNSDLDYVRYALPGLKEDDSIPEAYLDEIVSWGWKQKETEDNGSSLVFEKGKNIVHLSVHDDFLIITVPAQFKKQVIQGLESNKANE